MNLPVKITKVEWAGGACPYQIEATTDDNRQFYLRYRGGRLRAGVSEPGKIFLCDGKNYNVIDIQYGHSLAGSVNHKEFMPLLEGKVIFPVGFSMDDDIGPDDQEADPRDNPFVELSDSESNPFLAP